MYVPVRYKAAIAFLLACLLVLELRSTAPRWGVITNEIESEIESEADIAGDMI